MLRIPLFALTSCLLVAQAPTPLASPTSPESKLEATPQPDAVLAHMGERVIRQSEFEEYLLLVLNDHQRENLESTPGGMEMARQRFLDMTVMIAKARKDGLDRNSTFLRRVEWAKTQLLLEELLKRAGSEIEHKVAPSDKDVKAFFAAHKEDYKISATFSARQILVSIKGGQGATANALPEAEAKAKATDAAKALAAGKSWDEVAKAFSDDPGSREKGGLYENISFGAFVPEFDQAILKQEIGKVGEPVRSKFGFHVIQVEQRSPSTLPSFEEVKDGVRSKLMDAKRKEAFQAYLDATKKEVGLEVTPAVVKAATPPLTK